MAQENKPFNDPANQMGRAEAFLTQNQKVVTYVVGAVLLVVLAAVAVRNFYLPGQEAEAQQKIYQAQNYFEQDSFNIALNGSVGVIGGEDVMGFLEIISNYGWTNAANLSNYYAGICYLRMGQYEDAIRYLKKFDSDDLIVSTMALGAIGDAYMELGKTEEGISYYKKAADLNKNEFSTPMFLFKAGLALQTQGKAGEALKLYEQIKNDYPKSAEAQNIEKYIAQVENAG